MFDALGLPVKFKKVEEPKVEIIYLGIIINANTGSKMQKILLLLEKATRKPTIYPYVY